MPTSVRIEPEYVLQGVVVDRATQRGVPGVRVDAWDRDTKYHDLLGQVVTDADGAFTIGFDGDYFGDFAPDRLPDVFFKVFLDDKEVLSTFDRPQRNLPRGVTRVRLEIDLPRPVPAGKDRVSTRQALKAIDWWQASDFRGVLRQRRDQVLTVGKLVGALAGDALKKFDFEPVRPKGAREREIVNQTPDNARVALAQQQVEVTGVRSVSALTPSEKARMVAGYPLRLKAGDRVTLYEENGTVKYYTRDPKPASSADAETVARIDDDVQTMKARVATMDDFRSELVTVKTTSSEVAARTADQAALVQTQAAELVQLRRQLEQVQQASASKDVQITKLRNDLTLVTQAQDALAARLPLSRLDALEQQLHRLTRSAPGESRPAAPPTPPATPAAAGRPRTTPGKPRPKAKATPRKQGRKGT